MLACPISLTVGVGAIDGAPGVGSPAAPMIAWIGPLGMLCGERAVRMINARGQSPAPKLTQGGPGRPGEGGP